jgi:hypothetical protein
MENVSKGMIIQFSFSVVVTWLVRDVIE